MKKLFYFLIALVIFFFLSSVFRGGDFVRLISAKTGINLGPLESIADSLSLGAFMEEQSGKTKSSQHKRVNQ